jgi:ribosomal protein S18 acetylase RimI-like enzyme
VRRVLALTVTTGSRLVKQDWTEVRVACGRMELEIRALGPGDDEAVVAAQHLFDGPAKPEATARFLSEPGSHLLVAYVEGEPAGFVSGVEVTHPDKGTEMFLYELAVDEAHRRRGHGRALVEALGALARERGCAGMFVFVADDNEAGRAAYRSAGGNEDSRPFMVDWTFVRF